MLNNMTAIGYVGTKDDMKYTPSGTSICRFSLAINVGYGEKKKTMWMQVTGFGKTAEFVHNYVHKSGLVYVSGELNCADDGAPRTYVNKSGVTIATFEMTAREIKLLPSKQKDTENKVAEFEDAFPF